VTSGTAPVVTLKTQNISKSALDVKYSFECLPHVEGKNGELGKTYWHRRLRNESGVEPLDIGPGGNIDKPIKPGESKFSTFNLRNYYVFTEPGEFTVYVEVKDAYGKTVRTNTVDFTILSPSQR
jgi:hypothetical protein